MKTVLRILGLIIFFLVPIEQSFAADKRIGILVFDGVLTSDITAPIEVFGVANKKSWFSNYETVVINVENNPSVTTEEGLKIGTDSWIGAQPEVDVLIVPSSYDMEPLLDNQQLISFIQSTANKAEWMASNCSGSFILAEAGLLNQRKATTWFGGESSLKSSYPKVNVQFDQNIVIDGNVITSNGSLVSYQAALTLLGKMTSERKANEVAEALQYKRFSEKKYNF